MHDPHRRGGSQPSRRPNQGDQLQPAPGRLTTTIIILINRHAELHRELDRLYQAGGDDAVGTPAYRAAAAEALAPFEHTIVAVRATTAAEREAKQAFVASYLLAAIFELDAAATVAEAA